MLTRFPWQLTYFLDPMGLQYCSWGVSNLIPGVSEDSLKQFESVRSFYSRVFNVTEPFQKFPERFSNYRQVVLVCGQVSGHFSFDASSAYRSQTHMLLDVLRHVPPDFAVLYSEHPNTPFPISVTESAWLKDSFSNVFFASEEFGDGLGSQYFVRHVDVVATVSSTIGWQALFWGKKLVALGASQLNPFADCCDVKEIVSCGRKKNKDELAAWLLFNYCIPVGYFLDGKWLQEYFESRLESWRCIRGLDILICHIVRQKLPQAILFKRPQRKLLSILVA